MPAVEIEPQSIKRIVSLTIVEMTISSCGNDCVNEGNEGKG